MSAERAPSAELLRLALFGEPHGPDADEALRLFAGLRRSAEERRAVDTLLARDARSPLPDEILVALASALVDRGDDATAAQVAARAKSTSALMLRAELLHRARDLGGAVALVERVLLRDVDWPGARERHMEWRGELGVLPAAREPTSAETLVAARPAAPYEVEREVGRGGAAVVYEARDRELGRRVALKVYHQAARDRAQLLHEARVAVTLAGPGIVRVFDADPDQGWLALEWAGLGALRALLRGGRAPPFSAWPVPIARWAIPLARSLGRVHAAGWVHHDVKPGNILLRAPDAPLLGDFGSARRVGDPSPPGSLGYLSPERLAGRPSDPRDDVFAFGRVLEDVIDAGCWPAESGLEEPWRALAAACTGPDETRPPDGQTLLARALELGRVRD